jgi:hypothetical protein
LVQRAKVSRVVSVPTSLAVKLLVSSFLIFSPRSSLKILLDFLSFLRCSCFFKYWISFHWCPLILADVSSWVPHTTFDLAISLMTIPLTPYRNGTVSHPSAGGSQLLLEPPIALRPFIQFSVGPCG